MNRNHDIDQFFDVMREQRISLTYGDVRLKTDYSEFLPKDVDLATLFSRNIPLKCPLVSAPMDSVTTSKMAIAMAMAGGLGIIHRGRFIDTTQVDEVTQVKKWIVNREIRDECNLDDGGRLRVGAAIGTGDAAVEAAFQLQVAGADVVVIDTSHGDSKGVYETLKALKNDTNFHIDVVVGNVSEDSSARRLAKAGADAIKVGQGPGSICTTRIVAGIGAPQVTAVYECARILQGSDVPVCADGGIINSGDITIAIGIGASSIMSGRLFAGTDEAPGKVIDIDGTLFKVYRGMGSASAMKDSEASMQRYSQENKGNLVPQGVEGIVPYRGQVSKLIEQYIGGLRSGMGYVGAGTIEELRLKANLRRFSNASIGESHPHDVVINSSISNLKGESQL